MNPEASRPRVAAAQSGLRVSAVIAVGAFVPSLESAIRAVLAEPWIDELVLVDAGADGADASRLRGLQADRRDVRFIQSGQPLTVTQARNLGAARAAGRWLLFLDPDVVVQRGAVERLVKAGRLARSPWIVGGALTDANGRRRGVTAGARLGRRPTPVERVDGGFLLTPRAEFLGLGSFDEDYVGHGETRDLCRRARTGGGSVWLQPAAEGVEFEGARRKNRAVDAADRVSGAALFARKHARTPVERIVILLATPLIMAGVALRALALTPLRRRS